MVVVLFTRDSAVGEICLAFAQCSTDSLHGKLQLEGSGGAEHVTANAKHWREEDQQLLEVHNRLRPCSHLLENLTCKGSSPSAGYHRR
jgi:hypothetical protein